MWDCVKLWTPIIKALCENYLYIYIVSVLYYIVLCVYVCDAESERGWERSWKKI